VNNFYENPTCKPENICGGKRSATPLWKLYPQSKSGVVAALCHRSPKSSLAESGQNGSLPFFRNPSYFTLMTKKATGLLPDLGQTAVWPNTC
jgi:hypothetical protein